MVRRKQSATDKGDDESTPIADAVDKDDDAAEWITHVSDTTDDFKIRHTRSIRTEVEDRSGDVVHRLVETYDDDADADSLSFSGGDTCPVDDHDAHDTDYDGDRIRHSCDEDGCPFEVTVGYRPTGEDTPNHKTPTYYRAVIPHAGIGTDSSVDFDSLVDAADLPDEDDTEGVANIIRNLALSRFVGNVRDDAYVSSEYDGDPYEDEDAEKVADAYIDTFECARCGAEHDVGAERSHPNHDDPVCRACEDDHVWGFDDADLPDDVEDVFESYKSVTPAKIRGLLRDVTYYPAWVASGDDDMTVDDAPACPTGAGAKRTVTEGPGGSSSGSGFRRASDGFAHSDANWRYIVREARDAGLIERVDDEDDADFDDAAARWEATDKGDDVFDALARCVWCGSRLEAARHEYTVKLSRWNTTTNIDLITTCPCGCREDHKGKTTTLGADA